MRNYSCCISKSSTSYYNTCDKYCAEKGENGSQTWSQVSLASTDDRWTFLLDTSCHRVHRSMDANLAPYSQQRIHQCHRRNCSRHRSDLQKFKHTVHQTTSRFI